jgi:hypothetical protein
MDIYTNTQEGKKESIAPWIAVIVGLLILFTLLAGLVIFAYQEDAAHQAYLDSLSPDELEAYYESNRARYEVIGVSMYTTRITNSFGGVTRTDVKYVVRYIDGNKIKELSNLEYDDFRLGDVDQYIIDNNERTWYIVLTEETLRSIK